MFQYFESYGITFYRTFNDNELQEIANDYKNYVNYHNDIIDIDSFSNYIIDKCIFDFSIKYDVEFNDSNIENFYNEIKKYL